MIDIISHKELKTKLDCCDPFTLIDTLPKPAYRQDHLPGVINIPSDDILNESLRRLPDKQATVVVYRASESCERAGLTAERVARLDYSRIVHYVGGKKAWVATGATTGKLRINL